MERLMLAVVGGMAVYTTLRFITGQCPTPVALLGAGVISAVIVYSLGG